MRLENDNPTSCSIILFIIRLYVFGKRSKMTYLFIYSQNIISKNELGFKKYFDKLIDSFVDNIIYKQYVYNIFVQCFDTGYFS